MAGEGPKASVLSFLNAGDTLPSPYPNQGIGARYACKASFTLLVPQPYLEVSSFTLSAFPQRGIPRKLKQIELFCCNSRQHTHSSVNSHCRSRQQIQSSTQLKDLQQLMHWQVRPAIILNNNRCELLTMEHRI